MEPCIKNSVGNGAFACNKQMVNFLQCFDTKKKCILLLPGISYSVSSEYLLFD